MDGQIEFNVKLWAGNTSSCFPIAPSITKIRASLRATYLSIRTMCLVYMLLNYNLIKIKQ